MRFFKSIRWRLQLWYGLLFAGMLCGFGFTAWHLERVGRFRQIDEELGRRISIVAAGLRAGPPGPPGRAGRTDLKLAPREAALFEEQNAQEYYFVAWLRNGPPVTRSPGAPMDVPKPERGDAPVRQRGTVRESFLFTAPDDCLLVGRELGPDLASLNGLAWVLVSVGSGVLALGMAGGWWLTSRALRPIRDISRTAAGIAKGDLSRRINGSQTESELGALAGVLNHTFARLEAAFTQQTRFTSDAAHELRTPVTVLLTQVQATLARERTPAEYRDTLAVCQRAAQRMRRLIESLLELARLDAGAEPMRHANFDLAESASDCLDLLHVMADEKKVSLQSDLSEALCHGDPDRLGQVIMNLLANAIHYNREHGTVRVSVYALEHEVCLVVADTGKGIAEEDLPHVFERFYRADKARTTAQERNGLGLAISKAIVEAHRGTIEVFSEVGKGSVFTVRLPGAVDAKRRDVGEKRTGEDEREVRRLEVDTARTTLDARVGK